MEAVRGRCAALTVDEESLLSASQKFVKPRSCPASGKRTREQLLSMRPDGRTLQPRPSSGKVTYEGTTALGFQRPVTLQLAVMWPIGSCSPRFGGRCAERLLSPPASDEVRACGRCRASNTWDSSTARRLGSVDGEESDRIVDFLLAGNGCCSRPAVGTTARRARRLVALNELSGMPSVPFQPAMSRPAPRRNGSKLGRTCARALYVRKRAVTGCARCCWP